MKKLLFIYNSHAGKLLIKEYLSDIIEIFNKEGFETTIRLTKEKDNDELLKDVDSFDRIICSGGDGTLSIIISLMLKYGNKKEIGYIPSGSTNDFSYTLGLPSENMLECAKIACTNSPKTVDVISINDRKFLYVSAFGNFVDITYNTDQNLKNVFGYLAYVFTGANKIFNLKNYNLEITIDGQTKTNKYLLGMICNTTSVGGFKRLNNIIDYDIELNDKKFEIILIRSPKSFENIIDCIEEYQTDNIIIKNLDDSTLPLTIDGEDGTTEDKILNIKIEDEINIYS